MARTCTYLLILLGIISLPRAYAWERSSPIHWGQEPTDPGKKLDFLILEKNGTRVSVRDGEILQILRGDKLKLIDAKIRDGSSATKVNFVGFSPPKSRGSHDLRYTIDTGRDLIKKWSGGGAGKLYTINANTGDLYQGHILLELIEPSLEYCEVLIDGKPKILRENESLTVSASSKFKVNRVVTNVDVPEEVMFDIVPEKAASGNTPNGKLYSIEFSRSGRIFGKIPLRIESL